MNVMESDSEDESPRRPTMDCESLDDIVVSIRKAINNSFLHRDDLVVANAHMCMCLIQDDLIDLHYG